MQQKKLQKHIQEEFIEYIKLVNSKTSVKNDDYNTI